MKFVSSRSLLTIVPVFLRFQTTGNWIHTQLMYNYRMNLRLILGFAIPAVLSSVPSLAGSFCPNWTDDQEARFISPGDQLSYHKCEKINKNQALKLVGGGLRSEETGRVLFVICAGENLSCRELKFGYVDSAGSAYILDKTLLVPKAKSPAQENAMVHQRIYFELSGVPSFYRAKNFHWVHDGSTSYTVGLNSTPQRKMNHGFSDFIPLTSSNEWNWSENTTSISEEQFDSYLLLADRGPQSRTYSFPCRYLHKMRTMLDSNENDSARQWFESKIGTCEFIRHWKYVTEFN